MNTCQVIAVGINEEGIFYDYGSLPRPSFFSGRQGTELSSANTGSYETLHSLPATSPAALFSLGHSLFPGRFAFSAGNSQ